MRAFAFVCILALQTACATPAPASAQEPTPAADIATLHACLAGRDVPDGEPRDCIGVVSRACADEMDDGGASSTGGMVTCSAREQSAWRGVLEAAVTELRARESATQLPLLDRALEAGEQWTRARCAYDASIYEGGSLARVVAASCWRDTIALRAIDLSNRLAEYNEH